MRAPLTLVLLGIVASKNAEAHIELIEPVSRHTRDELKAGPCGVTGSARSANISYFRPGETIQIRFIEYIDHPGHYRVAFDDRGDDVFVDPPCLSDCDNTRMEIAIEDKPWILADGITDRRATPEDNTYELEVTLPEIECDDCTLQLIQVMTDKPPYVVGTNDLYYACADLVLTYDAPPPRDEPRPSPPEPEDDPPSPAPAEPPAPQTDPLGSGCQTTQSESLCLIAAMLFLGHLRFSPNRVERLQPK